MPLLEGVLTARHDSGECDGAGTADGWAVATSTTGRGAGCIPATPAKRAGPWMRAVERYSFLRLASLRLGNITRSSAVRPIPAEFRLAELG